MARRKVRCAVIGLGRLGQWHVINLATKVEGAELVCVCDSNKMTAQTIAKKYGVNDYKSNPDDIMEDDQIDAVVIATPTHTHAAYVKKAAACGKHIFVEKPLAEKIRDAEEIVTMVEKQNIICQIGFMRRFDPAYSEAKRRIHNGDIGIPIYFKSWSRDPISPPAEFIKKSGGIFLDIAIHDFDMARYLLDTEVTSVHSHGSVLKHPFMYDCGDVDQALTFLTFASGASGDVESSRNAYYGYDARCEIIGTEGTLVISSDRKRDLTLLTPNGKTNAVFVDFADRFEEAFVLELEHFIHCIRNRQTPLVTALDGKKALEVAIAAKKSFVCNKTVKL